MIIQKVRVQIGVSQVINFVNTNLFSRQRVYRITALPSFITESLDVYGRVDTFTINGTTEGTSIMYFSYGGSPATNGCQLIIEVVSSFTNTLETCNNSEAINIIWINRQGGRCSYIFDQRKNFSVDVPKNRTFDNNGIIKNVYNGKIFEQKTVYKTGLSREEIDLIDTLRYSIQAWEYNETTDVSTPIFIEPNSFDKYNTKENMYEINIKYKLAEYKEIQNQ